MKRVNKVPEKWTDGELKLWANEQAQANRGVSGGAIAQEAAKRFGLDESLKVSEIKELVKQLPEDAGQQSQAQETAEDAPTEEKDSSQDEDTPEEPQAPEDAPEEDHKESEAVAPIPEVIAQQPIEPNPEPAVAQPELAPKEQGTKSVTRSIFDDQLTRYLKAMRPGTPISVKDGAKHQLVLYRTIQMTLGQEGSEFSAYYGDLLKTIKEHRQSTFHERYAFRFMDNVQLATPERRNFERLLHLMITTCEPATRRQDLKQLDMDAAISGLPQDVQQKLQEYYTSI